MRATLCWLTILVASQGGCSRSSPAPSSPTQNAAPIVTVAFEGSPECTPQPARPCTLSVVAQASDPDGDTLSYIWAGCATGTSARSVCTVARPGTVVASVEVRDDHGHSVRGEASGVGVNHPPRLQIGYITRFPSSSLELLGNVGDPDETSACGPQYCVSIAAAGACRPLDLDCTCLAGLVANVTPTAASGACTVTVTLKDSWGQAGTPSVTFDVANPTPWVVKQ